MIRVFVRNLEFYAYHGVPDAEREIGHRYVLCLDMEVDARATETDLVQDTVDYGEAAKLVQETCQEGQYRTLEKLAYVAAHAVLDRFPKVQALKLRIAKKAPPAPLIVEELGVEIELRRG